MGRLPKVTQKDIYEHFGVQFPSAEGIINKTAAVHQKKKHSKKPLPPPINIDLSKVIFSGHALKRLAQRFLFRNPELQISFLDLIRTAEKIFAGSTEKNAIDPTIKVRRCITHKFKEARYFINHDHGLRFVVLEEGNRYKVVTIERSYDSKPNEIRTLADVMPEDE